MNHTWKIYDLKRTVADGVVNKITYACESDHEGIGTRKIGEFTVTGSVNDPDFIAYEDLTQDDVLGWVDTSIDKTIFETENSASIAERIEAQAAITESNGTPWD